MTAFLVETTQPRVLFGSTRPPTDPAAPSESESDRPPVCPVCNKRLVILASRSGRDPSGAFVRRQLWGCPRGHATADYVDGTFGPIEILPTAD